MVASDAFQSIYEQLESLRVYEVIPLYPNTYHICLKEFFTDDRGDHKCFEELKKVRKWSTTFDPTTLVLHHNKISIGKDRSIYLSVKLSKQNYRIVIAHTSPKHIDELKRILRSMPFPDKAKIQQRCKPTIYFEADPFNYVPLKFE